MIKRAVITLILFVFFFFVRPVSAQLSDIIKFLESEFVTKPVLFKLEPLQMEKGSTTNEPGTPTNAPNLPSPTSPPSTQAVTNDILDSTGNKAGTVYITPNGANFRVKAEFLLPPPQQGYVYEVWLVREAGQNLPNWISLGKAQLVTKPDSSQLFVVEYTSVPAGIMSDHKNIKITLEPDDNNDDPTLQVILMSDLSTLSQNPTQPAPTTPQQPTASQQPTEPSPTTGQPTSAPDPLHNIINAVSEQKIKEYLTNLVDDDDTQEVDETQTRYSSTGGNETEANYIKTHFENLGISASFQQFRSTAGSTQNIIGTIPGTKSNEYYVVTAHMDSTSPTRDPAPGADDNGSGTAAVMEIARVLKESGQDFNYSIEFILFSAEETGLEGSYYYARNLPTSKQIKGVINLDMIGNRGSSDCVNFLYKPRTGSNILSEKVIEMNQQYSLSLSGSSQASSLGLSDHKPFWDKGIPAIFGHECLFSPVYHTTNDKTDRINFAQMTKATKAVAAAITSFALAQ